MMSRVAPYRMLVPLYLLLVCAGSWAQSLPAPQNPPPVSSYQGKTYFLRSLCGDSKLEFNSDGTLKAPCHLPIDFRLAGISIQSVQLKGNKLVAKANRIAVSAQPGGDIKLAQNDEVDGALLKENLTMIIKAPADAHTGEDYAQPLAAILTANSSELITASGRDALAPGKNGVSNPVFRHSTPPPIEDLLKLRGKGTTKVSMVIGLDGIPTNVRILEPSGQPGFDEEAIITAKAYRYKSAEKDGKPVMVRMVTEINLDMQKAGR